MTSAHAPKSRRRHGLQPRVCRQHLRDERGVAMMMVIAAMMLIAGLLAALAMVTTNETSQVTNGAKRTQSLLWLHAATDDLATRLQGLEIGSTVVPSPDSKYQLWKVPTTSAWDGGKSAFKINVNIAGQNQDGWYQILPPIQGAPANTVAFDVNPSDPANQGSVTVILKGWTGKDDEQPQTVRAVLQRGTLARFAVLSDDPIDVDAAGISLSGSLHSNNVTGKSVGIKLSSASTGSAEEISTTNGSISGSCHATHCLSNTQQPINIGDAELSFNEVAQASTRSGDCSTASFVACNIHGIAPSGNNTVPMWNVNISGTCVRVGHSTWGLRQDVGNIAAVDDQIGPTSSTQWQWTYCPANGGGALMFDGDVVLQGSRASNAPPVTILADRRSDFPSVKLNNKPLPMNYPASIYLLQTGSLIGSPNAKVPVGMIAQGGVYIPSYTLSDAPYRDRNLTVRNAAVVAEQAEFSLGPMILAITPDAIGSGGAASGGGLTSCAAEDLDFGQGQNFTFSGAIISHREPMFRYGTACYVGFKSRKISYADDLTWNPPPFFPTDTPWHLAQWNQFNS